MAHYGSKGVFLPAAIICPSQFITAAANQEFTVAERQLQRTWTWAATRTFYLETFFPRLSDRKSYCSTVIIVIMPTPHFYRKYAPPFSEGSFLKILWLEMPG